MSNWTWWALLPSLIVIISSGAFILGVSVVTLLQMTGHYPQDKETP